MKKILAASWDYHHLNDNKLCKAVPQHPLPQRWTSPCTKAIWPPSSEWQCSLQEADQQAAYQSEVFYNIGIEILQNQQMTFMAEFLLLDLTEVPYQNSEWLCSCMESIFLKTPVHQPLAFL